MSTPASRIVLLCFFLVPTVNTLRASSVDAAVLAAMKLPEARNYHWLSTVEDDARLYEIEGRTEKDGYTRVTMPMVTSLRRKLGTDGGGMQTMIFKGDMSCVIETANGWTTPQELSSAPGTGRAPMHGATHASTGTGGRFPHGRGNGTPIPYSNLQPNLSHPHDEIGIIVGSYTDAHVDADGINGTLSEEGAKLLLVHPGQDEITPLAASGTFKIWIKDGVLVKYQVRLTGTISVGEGPQRREISLHQNTTTEIRDVGTTRFDVPEEARLKLG